MSLVVRIPARYIADGVARVRQSPAHAAPNGNWMTYAATESRVGGQPLALVSMLAYSRTDKERNHAGRCRLRCTDSTVDLENHESGIGDAEPMSVSINIGIGRLRGRYSMRVVREGRTETSASLEIVGDGVTRLSSIPVQPSAISPEAAQRWSRTISAIGGDRAWNMLTDRAIAIVGCGRLGSRFAMELAGLNMRRLILVDFDRAELHNLGECATFAATDIGALKTSAVTRAVRSINPSVHIDEIPMSVARSAATDALKEADLIVCCADDEAARLCSGITASLYHTAIVDAGSNVALGSSAIGGSVRLVVPGEGCLLCRGGGLNLREDAVRRVADASEEAVFIEDRDWTRERRGSLASINMQVCGFGLQLILNYFLQRGPGSRAWNIVWERDGVPRIIAIASGPEARRHCLCSLSGLGDEGNERVREWLREERGMS
jgi:hypothetical protein